MKYQNRKNGKVAELVSMNEKFKTVRLRYEDGTERDYTTSTLGKSFKKLAEEETVAVAEPVVEEKEAEEVAPVVEDVEEKQEDKKNAVQKTVRDSITDFLKNLCAEGAENVDTIAVRYWGDYYFGVKLNKKAVLEVRIKKNGSITIYVKEEKAKELGLEYSVVKNYYLPAVVKDVAVDTIKKLFM